MPSLDPDGDRRSQAALDYQRRVAERDAATPWYVSPLRWGGLAACIGGGLGIVYTTSAANDPQISHVDYVHLRARNDLSWAFFIAGTGAFAVSFPLQPALGPPRVAAARSAWSVGVGPSQIDLTLAFEP